MIKKIFTALILTTIFTASLTAQDALQYENKMAETSIFDPAFQDFVETVYGYKNPRSGLGAAGVRDAVAEKPAAAAPRTSEVKPTAVKPSVAAKAAPASVFVTIFPKGGNTSALISTLTSLTGFSLSGERVVHSALGKKTAVVGWAGAAAVPALCADPAVLGVFTGTAGSYKPLCPGK